VCVVVCMYISAAMCYVPPGLYAHTCDYIVCMYVCMYVNVYLHKLAFIMYPCMYLYVCLDCCNAERATLTMLDEIRMYMCAYIHEYLNAYKCIHTYTHMHTCIHACIHLQNAKAAAVTLCWMIFIFICVHTYMNT
jgi:hypothetical protein